MMTTLLKAEVSAIPRAGDGFLQTFFMTGPQALPDELWRSVGNQIRRVRPDEEGFLPLPGDESADPYDQAIGSQFTDFSCGDKYVRGVVQFHLVPEHFHSERHLRGILSEQFTGPLLNESCFQICLCQTGKQMQCINDFAFSRDIYPGSSANAHLKIMK